MHEDRGESICERAYPPGQADQSLTCEVVDLVAHRVEHLAEALEHLRAGILLLGVIEALTVDVTNSDDVRAFSRDGHVGGSFTACAADPGDVELFHTAFLADEQIRDENAACRQSGVAQERTTVGEE